MSAVVVKVPVRDARSAPCERCVADGRARPRVGLYVFELGWRAGRVLCRECLRVEAPSATIAPTRGVR